MTLTKRYYTLNLKPIGKATVVYSIKILGLRHYRKKQREGIDSQHLINVITVTGWKPFQKIAPCSKKIHFEDLLYYITNKQDSNELIWNLYNGNNFLHDCSEQNHCK